MDKGGRKKTEGDGAVRTGIRTTSGVSAKQALLQTLTKRRCLVVRRSKRATSSIVNGPAAVAASPAQIRMRRSFTSSRAEPEPVSYSNNNNNNNNTAPPELE
mmetsp:Transcript_19835/g.43061  ORF Transcript_19835/g.43061 Transcript_19835/m.43061 type:complete len:102 (-) Transcript_19835:118-423(-)